MQRGVQRKYKDVAYRRNIYQARKAPKTTEQTPRLNIFLVDIFLI